MKKSKSWHRSFGTAACVCCVMPVLLQRELATRPLIDEDVPPVYALQLEDAMGIPRVGLQLRSHVGATLCTYDEHRSAFVVERATHQDEARCDAINKAGVVIPVRLLTCT